MVIIEILSFHAFFGANNLRNMFCMASSKPVRNLLSIFLIKISAAIHILNMLSQSDIQKRLVTARLL